MVVLVHIVMFTLKMVGLLRECCAPVLCVPARVAVIHADGLDSRRGRRSRLMKPLKHN